MTLYEFVCYGHIANVGIVICTKSFEVMHGVIAYLVPSTFEFLK